MRIDSEKPPENILRNAREVTRERHAELRREVGFVIDDALDPTEQIIDVLRSRETNEAFRCACLSSSAIARLSPLVFVARTRGHDRTLKCRVGQ